MSSICGATIGHINRTSEMFVDPLIDRTMYNGRLLIKLSVECAACRLIVHDSNLSQGTRLTCTQKCVEFRCHQVGHPSQPTECNWLLNGCTLLPIMKRIFDLCAYQPFQSSDVVLIRSTTDKDDGPHCLKEPNHPNVYTRVHLR